MLFKLFIPALLVLSTSLVAQYKNDNVLYKTVSPENLCATLEKNKGYLLLDVRSKGEYSDTSSYTGLNIGHLKGAVNINVRELGSRLSEIKTYKDQPVFVYCSHSQRSRRAGKMLSDSGFTNIYNINGGMTSIYYTNAREKDCLKSMVESNNKYAIISALELCKKLSATNNNLFLLDVRADSAFRHISTDAKTNAYGSLKNVVNIPLASLENKINNIPPNKEIVIIDIEGVDASKAAYLLKEKGFANVSFLIEGIDRWLGTDANELPCKYDYYNSPVSYQIMSTKEFGRFNEKNKDHLLLDIRPADAFNNKHKDGFRNVGHLKNARNIPVPELSNRVDELAGHKNKDIVIYGFSGDEDSYKAANVLAEQGFRKVYVLIDGLFDIRWTAANIMGQANLKDLVTDVPEVNR